MHLTMLASNGIQPEGWTVQNAENSIRALLVAALAIILIYLVITWLLKEKGNQGGDYTGALKKVLTVFIILSLLPLSGGIAIMMGYGEAMLGIVNSLIGFGKD